MRWTAVVPLKLGPDRKSRLAPRLPLEARAALADALAVHVVSCLCQSDIFDDIIVLAPHAPPGVEGRWLRDEGRGLNAELKQAAGLLRPAPLVVIHGDLPFLQKREVEDLVEGASRSGMAIAPDRCDVGTNALAVVESSDFEFAFGPNSFRRHCDASDKSAVIIRRAGLGFDIDTPTDLDDALALGWTCRAV